MNRICSFLLIALHLVIYDAQAFTFKTIAKFTNPNACPCDGTIKLGGRVFPPASTSYEFLTISTEKGFAEFTKKTYLRSIDLDVIKPKTFTGLCGGRYLWYIQVSKQADAATSVLARRTGTFTLQGGITITHVSATCEGRLTVQGVGAPPNQFVDILVNGKAFEFPLADNDGNFIGAFPKPLDPGNYTIVAQSTTVTPVCRSAPVSLTVGILSPANQSVCVGGTIRLVATPGLGTYTFVNQDGLILQQGDSNILTITNASSSNAGTYFVEVSSTSCTSPSNAVSVEVVPCAACNACS